MLQIVGQAQEAGRCWKSKEMIVERLQIKLITKETNRGQKLRSIQRKQ